MFADMAVIRTEMEMREMNEKTRQAQIEAEKKAKEELHKEWNKNYEVCRFNVLVIFFKVFVKLKSLLIIGG